MTWVTLAWVSVAAAAAGTVPATGAAGPQLLTSHVRPQLAMSVSGGASLGAYEAGFLYYSLEVGKRGLGFDARMMAGASAGSLNSFLALLSACGPPTDRPEDSLFWRTWIPLGVKELFATSPAGDESPLGVLSKEPLQRIGDEVEAVFRRGLRRSCDVVWGVTTTRLVPRAVSMAQARLQLPRVEEKFVLRVVGQGLGQLPRLTNYVDPNYGLEQAALPEAADGSVAFAAARDLVLASSAFPVAFAPQRLEYCMVAGNRPGSQICGRRQAVAGLFIDGGVFDNSPLRLAASTVGAGLRLGADGRMGWLPRPQLGTFNLLAPVRLILVTPDAADYPTQDALGREAAPRSLLAMVQQLLQTFVSTARTKEIHTLLEERPELRERVYLPRRHYPTAGGLLSAFFGFFERDFRIFDFTLGMYDARRMFEDDVAGDTGFVFPETRVPVDRQWRRLLCMQQVFDGAPGQGDVCAGPELGNLRILLQVALERLYDTCAHLDPQVLPSTTNARCQLAARGLPPPRLGGVLQPADGAWRRQVDESELEYILSLLDRHKFVFHDLGLSADDAYRALPQIRGALDQVLARLVNAQPGSDRPLVQVGTEMLTDYVANAPPPRFFYFMLGRELEAGWSAALPRTRWLPQSLRLNAAVLLDGSSTWLASDRHYISLGAAAGLELQPRWLSNRLLQGRLVLRGGYLLAGNDGFLTGTCRHPEAQHNGDCSRPVLQAQVGVTAFDRLRLQLMVEFLPPTRAREHPLWSLAPAAGIQV